jgi:predicted Rossmann fold flavoprotein
MFTGEIKNLCENLSGISLPVAIESNNKVFEESMLFTHRGLSGPAILQISNYWSPGCEITINLLPNINAIEALLSQKQNMEKSTLKKYLTTLLPKALVTNLETLWWQPIRDRAFLEISNDDLKKLGYKLNAWKIKPASTEGYRTAEVTLGGVNTDAVDSKTMEIKSHSGLFFIGEVVDVTGHLGGYNFQWAWSSGYSAGLVA